MNWNKLERQQKKDNNKNNKNKNKKTTTVTSFECLHLLADPRSATKLSRTLIMINTEQQHMEERSDHRSCNSCTCNLSN